MDALPPPKLVASSTQFTTMLRDLLDQDSIAVDTESNSLYAYRERICLIQFSTRTQDYILDPLTISGIEPLCQVLSNQAIEKVFHAAEYDLACMYRDYGWRVNAIFDTMAAARALGWQHVGLANILRNRFGFHSNKRFQRTNWGKRPLTSEQITYAQADTHYLLPLRDVLANKLQKHGHWEETREEFDRISRVSMRRASVLDPRSSDQDGFWRIAGARKLNGKQAAMLQELYLYRDGVAARLDRAPYRVIGNSTLLEIATRNPPRKRDLTLIAGMTAGQIRRYGDGLLQAIERGRTNTPIHPPTATVIPPSVLARYKALREWRKERARARGVQSDVIMPRDVLWDLAYHDPTDLPDLDSIHDLGPWRRHNYGDEILTTLQNVAGG